MRLLRAIYDYWTSPDSDPWLVLAREQFAEFSRNRPQHEQNKINRPNR
jgi:hypothetical protein